MRPGRRSLLWRSWTYFSSLCLPLPPSCGQGHFSEAICICYVVSCSVLKNSVIGYRSHDRSATVAALNARACALVRMSAPQAHANGEIARRRVEGRRLSLGPAPVSAASTTPFEQVGSMVGSPVAEIWTSARAAGRGQRVARPFGRGWRRGESGGHVT